MLYSDTECQRICTLTHQYLHWIIYRICKDHARSEEILMCYQNPTHERGALSLSELYQHFLGHVQNTSTGGSGMRRVFGSSWGANPVHKSHWTMLGTLLGGFDPHYVRRSFPTIERLRAAIIDTYKQNVFTGPAERFTTSVFEIGHFLAQFPDRKSVYTYMDRYYDRSPTALIRHLLAVKGVHKRALFGLGDALMRDALKELGYVNYVKPDMHITDIARLLHIGGESTNNEQIAEIVADIALRGGITPYHLDKFLFLIGSGDLYQDGHDDIGIVLRRRDSVARKEDFAAYVLERLSLPPLTVGDRVALLVNSYEDSGVVRGQVGRISNTLPHLLFQVEFFDVQGQQISSQSLYPTEFVALHGAA